MILLTLIPLLPAMVQGQHQFHEVLLINRLNNFFGFDHNIFFLDSSTENYIDMSFKDDNAGNSFTPQTVYVFDLDNHVDVNGTQVAGLRSVSGDTFLIVVVEPSQFRNNEPLLARVKAIRMLHVNVKIGMFFIGNVTSTVIIEELFQWSWSVGIVNIFCTFYSSVDSDASPSFNVFRFDPFRTLHLINLTGSGSLQNYFPDKVPNYRGHAIRMAVLGYLSYDVFDLKFWIEIKKALNASYSVIRLSRKDVQSKRFETAEETSFDFYMPESHHIRTEGTKIFCYPHKMGTIVLLVPHAKQRSGIVGYIQNATWKLIFILTSIGITAASLLLTINAYLNTRKNFLLPKVVDVVNLLMNDNDAIKYGQLNLTEILVIVPLTFVGLIVMNGVLSVFQSYLTLPLYERQINSLEELYESSVPIIEDTSLFWSSRTNEMLEVISQHGGWQHKMIRKSFQDEADYFNDSAAFFVYGHQAQIYLEAQKQLGLKAYHLVTGVTFDTFYSIYQISSRFPFIDRVNDVVHRLQSAGLIEKWYKAEDDETIDELTELNRYFKTDKADKETDYSELIILWIGWIGSGIVFVCEIIWNKVQTRVENQKKKLIAQWQRILRK